MGITILTVGDCGLLERSDSFFITNSLWGPHADVASSEWTRLPDEGKVLRSCKGICGCSKDQPQTTLIFQLLWFNLL